MNSAIISIDQLNASSMQPIQSFVAEWPSAIEVRQSLSQLPVQAIAIAAMTMDNLPAFNANATGKEYQQQNERYSSHRMLYPV